MKHLSLFLCLLVTTTFSLIAFAQQAITISPLDKTHIQVEYTLPQQCSEVLLQEKYEGRASSLREGWKGLDNCSRLTNGNTITILKGCRHSRFSVPMNTAFIDRVEPVAYPMDDLGVRVHTGTFGVTDTCGNTTWIFKSPKGSVVDESGVYPEFFKASLTEKKYLNYTGIYLSYKPLKKDTRQIFTSRTPPELKIAIQEGQQQLTEYYRKTYPNIPFISPFLLVDNIPNQNGFGSQAEVTSPHMIRIGYIGWSPNRRYETQLLQAHEYAHLLQSKKHRPSSPFFHEGGAEFISLSASYHLGWTSKQMFSDRMSSAIQNCINLSNNKSWNEIKSAFGRIPYDCGLAMFTLALAGRQHSDSSEKTLENYYTSGLGDTHFANAIECGFHAECTPKFIPEFTDSKKSISSVIIEALNQLKLVTNLRYSNENSLNNEGISAAFSNLMIEDCKGTDFYVQKNYFQTGDFLTCKTIPQKSTITTVNGINYFLNPEAAIDAQNQGCSTINKIVLSDGKDLKLEVPCKKITHKTYYSIDVDRLLILLDGRSPGV
jgi:hypothetical protein